MPSPITLTYYIPKNNVVDVATQKTRFSSLDLNPGPVGERPLDKLELQITSDSVTDTGPGNPDKPLLRALIVGPGPNFVNVFGPLEDPANWGLQTLFQQQIALGLATICTVTP